LIAVSVQRSFGLQECEANVSQTSYTQVIDFISRLEAKDDIKKKAAAFFKKTARYYLAKKEFTNRYKQDALCDGDKRVIKDCLLEKLKTKQIFKECLQ
jgi:hypothetical protein